MNEEKLKRFRAKVGMNWIKDKQARIKRANKLLALARKIIKEGRVIGRDEDRRITYKEMTILEAIGVVLLKKMDTCGYRKQILRGMFSIMNCILRNNYIL